MANELAGIQLGANFFKPQFGNVKTVTPTVLTKDPVEIKKIVAQNEEAVKQAEAKRSEVPIVTPKPVVEQNVTAVQEVPTVASKPSFYEKNKNMIFIGAGISAVVIIGVVVYFKMRKPTK